MYILIKSYIRTRIILAEASEFRFVIKVDQSQYSYVRVEHRLGQALDSGKFQAETTDSMEAKLVKQFV